MTPWSIRRARAVDARDIAGLAEVLIDCVAGGASVSFMDPLTRDRAVAFWEQVARDVSCGNRALLIAEDAAGICGTAQLLLDLPENQPHRADVAKMLVHRRARSQGLGAALVRAAEAAARECGRTLLVLDTVTGSAADRLYTRMGWIRAGDIPKYALWPHGGLCSTTVFYRDLSPTAASDVAGVLNAADPSNGYDRVADEFMRTRRSIGGDVIGRWARSLPRGAAVLDIGCGHGVPITQALVDAGCHVQGIDASPRMVGAYRLRFPGVAVECAPVEDAAALDRSFDAITAWGLMFLLRPDAQARLIYRAAAALHAGGQFVFTSPATACEWPDNLTGRQSQSIGAEGYRLILRKAGFTLDAEADDDGGNHYYFARR